MKKHRLRAFYVILQELIRLVWINFTAEGRGRRHKNWLVSRRFVVERCHVLGERPNSPWRSRIAGEPETSSLSQNAMESRILISHASAQLLPHLVLSRVGTSPVDAMTNRDQMCTTSLLGTLCRL